VGQKRRLIDTEQIPQLTMRSESANAREIRERERERESLLGNNVHDGFAHSDRRREGSTPCKSNSVILY